VDRSGLLTVEAVALQSALIDIERCVTHGDIRELKSSASSWVLPQLLSEQLVAISSSLIEFKPHHRLGKFLVLSGVDKSGKETHCFNQNSLPGVTSVFEHLRSKGFSVYPVRQPAYDTLLGGLVGAHLGRRAATLKLSGHIESKYAWLLWSLDRAQFNPKVDSWLASGPKNVVLAKRWTESHAVYQPEVGVEHERVMKFETNIVKQDFTIVLDVSPATALRRLKARMDRDDYERASLIERVRGRYLRLSAIYPFGDVCLVDASRPLGEVNRDVLALVDELL
jgi:thymidylate kinase